MGGGGVSGAAALGLAGAGGLTLEREAEELLSGWWVAAVSRLETEKSVGLGAAGAGR